MTSGPVSSSPRSVIANRRRQACFVGSAIVWLIAGLSAGQVSLADDKPNRTAVRFVDRGRHLGLVQGDDAFRSRADSVLLWMLAASRVDPANADAYFWQYDLANRLRRTDAANAALNRYVSLQPENALAMLRWIDSAIADRQTVESRIAFCEEQLNVATQPEIIADLHLRLARFHRGRGHRDKALASAEAAHAAVPHDATATYMVLELRGNLRTDAGRVQLLLADIRANPADVQRVWRLGRELAGLSLHKQAAPWFDHALRIWPVISDKPEPPLPWILEAAQSAYDSGKYRATADRLAAIAEDTTSPMALTLYAQALKKLGQSDRADNVHDRLKRYIVANETGLLAGDNPAIAAGVAWFYLVGDPNVERASKFAKAAYDHNRMLPLARRVRGMAAALAGDLETAKRVLPRAVSGDQWAAEALASVYLQEKDAETAMVALRKAEPINLAGEAHARIAQRIKDLGGESLPVPDRADVRSLLDAFDQSPLMFATNPASNLSLDVNCDNTAHAFAHPIACTLTLSNTGNFPITLGEAGMVSPTVLVSVRMEHGDGLPEISHERYTSIALDRRLMLMPGEKLAVRRTVDVGVARDLVRSRPTRTVDLTFSFLLDPRIELDGSWTSRLHQFAAATASVTRAAADPSQLVPPSSSDHRQRWADWVAAATAFDPTKFDVNAMAAGLGLDDWAVRLLVLDTLARRDGNAFAPVLRRFSTDDPDPLVRMLASRHLHALKTSSPSHAPNQ